MMAPQPKFSTPQLRVPRPQPMRDPVLWTPDVGDQLYTLDSLPARTKHVPTVTCIFGRRGQGKTLMATTMGEQLKVRFDRAGLDFRLYSNYWTASSDRHDQHIVEDLQEFPQWLSDSKFSVLLIDEVAELLPSLRPMSNDNLLTMGFLKQIRKRGVSRRPPRAPAWGGPAFPGVIMATQYPQEVTTGILRQCDWFILSQAIDGGRHLKSFWWDWPGNITGNWGRKYFPPERDTHDFSFLFQNTYRMFGRYRTEEIIAPRFADRREAIRAEQEQLRLDAQSAASPPKDAPVDVPAGVGGPASFPPVVQAIVDDAAGSGIGVVWIDEIAEKLRRAWRKPRLTVEEIMARLRMYGAEIVMDQGQPYLVYQP